MVVRYVSVAGLCHWGADGYEAGGTEKSMGDVGHHEWKAQRMNWKIAKIPSS